MFRRLILEDHAALFTCAAFFTALSIFLTIAWRTLRMNAARLARFENLPFSTATPSSHATHPTDSSAG